MVETHTDRPGARGWAWVGLYGGLLLSLAGNEAHVWGDGSPGWGPAVASVIWPALLFVSLHIALHMGAGRGWAKWVGLGTVAAFSGAVSYWHLSSVLSLWGYGLLAWFGPLAIDGLMVMSTVVLTGAASEIAASVPVFDHARPIGPMPAVVSEAEPIPVQPAPEVHPVMPPQPAEPEHVTPGPAAEPPTAPKPEQRRAQAVHTRAGRALSGPELKADAVALVRAEGLSNAGLAQRYTPPLPAWRAREFVSEARKPVNGHAPIGTLS